MTVLVDTSVWIRFLSGKAPFLSGLSDLLDAEDVVGHPLVFGELLIGDRGGRARFLADYALLDQLPQIAHEEVVHLVRARRLAGRGAGWIDVHLLASVMTSGAALWTADPRLAALAEELNVGFTPPA